MHLMRTYLLEANCRYKDITVEFLSKSPSADGPLNGKICYLHMFKCDSLPRGDCSVIQLLCFNAME